MFTLEPVEKVPESLVELRLQVREFVQAEIATGGFVPVADSWMAGIDPSFSRRLADKGWVGMTVPTEHGGHARSPLERYVVTEELLAAGAPVAAHWIADRQMAPGILRNGTDEQKRKYLPGIVRGERFFAIGMSEPESGSDLASVRTKATEMEGGWRISGTKVWTTAAHIATNIVILARTDPNSTRHDGLSQFIVDLPHPDVQIRPIITIDGEHHFNEVVFDDAVIPKSAILGQRGEGWRQVTAELANERSGPERILSTFVLLSTWLQTADIENSTAGKIEVGRLLSRYVVLRQMSFAIAEKLRMGEHPAVEAALVKDLGTTFESDVVDVVRRHTAGNDKTVAKLLDQAILGAPAFTLRGGTNEVLKSVVAKGLSIR